MELFSQPQNSFMYVFVMYIFVLIGLNKSKYIRGILQYTIYSINDEYLQDRNNVVMLSMCFYAVLILNTLAYFGMPMLLSSPTMTAVLCFIPCIAAIATGIKQQGFIQFFVHLVPSSVPVALFPLILILELIGLMIRPFALTLRICLTNAISHMIFHVFESASPVFIQPLLVTMLLMDIVKAFLQAYLFTISIANFYKVCTQSH